MTLSVALSITITLVIFHQCDALFSGYLSLHIAKSVCKQTHLYYATRQLQDPVKKPPSPAEGCSWFQSKGERIVGGEENELNQFPSLALVRGHHPRTNHSYICGGVIIDEWWVMSAAHCWSDNTTYTWYEIFVGAHNRSNPPASQKIVNSTRCVLFPRHYSFEDKWKGYDIGLHRLDTPLVFDRPWEINKAEIAKKRKDTWGIVTGWGRTSSNAEQSLVPRHLNFTVLDYEKCRRDTINTFCAGVEKENVGTCKGDSGGPIYRIDGPKQHTILGIVTGGSTRVEDCNAADSVTVFTDVQKYYKWIKAILTT